jgi:hypothetical protein
VIAYGLDISLTGTGIACSTGWCERVGVKDITTLALDDRLAAVDDLAEQIVQLVGPDAGVVCVELPAFSRAGGGALERSALWWKVVHRLRVARFLPVAEVPIQARMRYATGKAMASKGAIIDAVARRWPAFETGGDDNLADAAVLAAIGADWLGTPITPVPAVLRKALDVVRWPVRLADAPKSPPAPRPSDSGDLAVTAQI